MSKVEDDFWNASSHSGFNFDDEDDSLGASLDDPVFQSLTEESSELPIHAIISKSGLEFVLGDLKSTLQIVLPTVDETIKKILTGHKYNLHEYVKFQDKIKLLEQSLNTYDANVIIKIIIYLKDTLKINIFYHQLSKRKTAIKHYAHYLMMKNRFEEMADLYMATGNTSHMKQLYYLTGQGVTNKQMLHKKFEQFVIQHLQKLNSNDDKTELKDHLQLIQFQMDRKCCANSVVKQLVELCKTDVSSQKGMERLRDFKKSFKIDDFTFEWTLLNILSSMQLWIHLNDIFIKNNWLTKKNSLKTSMSPDVLLNGLSRHNPPKEILEQYLSCISDTEKGFLLAQKFQCHCFVIQYYVNQRDRLALLNYKDKLVPQTSEYFLIESSLQSTLMIVDDRGFGENQEDKKAMHFLEKLFRIKQEQSCWAVILLNRRTEQTVTGDPYPEDIIQTIIYPLRNVNISYLWMTTLGNIAQETYKLLWKMMKFQGQIGR